MSYGYRKLEGDEGLLFDYSSGFTYNTTAVPSNTKYSSIFSYGKPLFDQPNVEVRRGIKQSNHLGNIMYWSAVIIYVILIIMTLPVSIWFVIKRVKSDEQVLLSRLGIIKMIKGPQIILVLPCVDKVTKYSTALRAFNVPPHKVLTSDGLLIEVGAVVRYSIVDAEKVFFSFQNMDHTLRVTAQTSLTKYITAHVQEKQLTDSTSIQQITRDIKYELQQQCHQWGIAVNSLEMTGLKALLRIEQQNAINDVIEPIKRWFFGQTGDETTPQMVSFDPASLFPDKCQVKTSKAQPETNSVQGNLAQLRGNLTANDLLQAVRSISTRQMVQQVDTLYKFIVPDDAIRVYYLDLKNGTGDCGVGEPLVGTADTIITISLANMRLMFTGELKPFDAYMSGDLVIEGDLNGAMKLDGLVRSLAVVTKAFPEIP